MIKKRRWLWVLLFILVVLLLGSLATGWNVVLVRDYYRMLELARNLPRAEAKAPWISLVLGTLGFVGLLGGLILFFVRLLQEMRLNQQQAEFLATVSHELKTPIATIELSSSLIQAGGIEEAEVNRLWKAHDLELNRLKSEVERLLEAARWQANAVPLEIQPLHLEIWLMKSLERWKNVLGPEGQLLREGTPLNCSVNLDPRYLGLIMDNLLDNARKFSNEAPIVTVRTELDGSDWKIRICDRGMGFSSEDATRIFKRFFRAKTDSPHSIPGTGLGLYLANAASRAMGIRLEAASEGPGKGATFTVTGKCASGRTGN